MSNLKINGAIKEAPFVDVAQVMLKDKIAIISFSLMQDLNGKIAERVCNVSMSIEGLKILEAQVRYALVSHQHKTQQENNPPQRG